VWPIADSKYTITNPLLCYNVINYKLEEGVIHIIWIRREILEKRKKN